MDVKIQGKEKKMKTLRHIDLDYDEITFEDVIEAVEDIRGRLFGESYKKLDQFDIADDIYKLIAHYALTQGMILDMSGQKGINPSLYVISIQYTILFKNMYYQMWQDIKDAIYGFIEDTWEYTDNWDIDVNDEYCFYYEDENGAKGMTLEEALPIVKNALQHNVDRMILQELKKLADGNQTV